MLLLSQSSSNHSDMIQLFKVLFEYIYIYILKKNIVFVITFLFLRHICIVGVMFVRCSSSKCKRCFLWLPTILSAIILRLIKLLGVGGGRGGAGAAQIYSERRRVKDGKDVRKVFFFPQPSSPTQKKCVFFFFFVKGMKILDFSFLLFVLTNKNLCLKRCVGFFLCNWFLTWPPEWSIAAFVQPSLIQVNMDPIISLIGLKCPVITCFQLNFF